MFVWGKCLGARRFCLGGSMYLFVVRGSVLIFFIPVLSWVCLWVGIDTMGEGVGCGTAGEH